MLLTTRWPPGSVWWCPDHWRPQLPPEAWQWTGPWSHRSHCPPGHEWQVPSVRLPEEKSERVSITVRVNNSSGSTQMSSWFIKKLKYKQFDFLFYIILLKYSWTQTHSCYCKWLSPHRWTALFVQTGVCIRFVSTVLKSRSIFKRPFQYFH